MFAGVSIEGSVIIERKDANSQFYNSKVSAKEILSGKVPKPAGADPLYRSLDRQIQNAGALLPQSHSEGYTQSTPTVAPLRPSQSAPGLSGDRKPLGRSTIGTSLDRNSRYEQLQNSNYSRDPPSYGAKTTPPSPIILPPPKPAKPTALKQTNVSWQPPASAQSRDSRPKPPLPGNRPKNTAKALHDFEAERDTDLSFQTGDIIIVTKMTDSVDDWWTGSCRGKTGDVLLAN